MRKKTRPTKRETPETVRGVPYRDYRALARLVRLGRRTWKQLERQGLVKPNAQLTDGYRKAHSKDR